GPSLHLPGSPSPLLPVHGATPRPSRLLLLRPQHLAGRTALIRCRAPPSKRSSIGDLTSRPAARRGQCGRRRCRRSLPGSAPRAAPPGHGTSWPASPTAHRPAGTDLSSRKDVACPQGVGRQRLGGRLGRPTAEKGVAEGRRSPAALLLLVAGRSSRGRRCCPPRRRRTSRPCVRPFLPASPNLPAASAVAGVVPPPHWVPGRRQAGLEAQTPRHTG